MKHAAYEQSAARFYNTRVQERAFSQGDLVLKKNVDPKLQRKLDPKWEGPYRITAVLGNGAYHLENMEGKNLIHAWNGDKLRRFYA